MTLREMLQAKIDAIKAQSDKDIADITQHFVGAEKWLDTEFEVLKTEAETLLAKVRAAL